MSRGQADIPEESQSRAPGRRHQSPGPGCGPRSSGPCRVFCARVLGIQSSKTTRIPRSCWTSEATHRRSLGACWRSGQDLSCPTFSPWCMGRPKKVLRGRKKAPRRLWCAPSASSASRCGVVPSASHVPNATTGPRSHGGKPGDMHSRNMTARPVRPVTAGFFLPCGTRSGWSHVTGDFTLAYALASPGTRVHSERGHVVRFDTTEEVG